ncbi:DUF4236 domain-containing protein [Bacillus cytotoxicus]|uniref:DUF4236 domain-containing protein n=1 Tax=Bacillus cytotoxicus TaxID=580165 RepID=A0AAX2CNS5_9BACI|nr:MULTISPECIES: DUF4236 domain-containing protein [Bacillus cereus group]QTR81193.1 DUF4236 domain-containing protein [Bacillus cytotoxicus]SCM08038.1 Uncharacterized protein BCB44BAC_04520 [Bacillus cytotoxicus]
MGFKFRKGIKVAPGVKVNVTHKGIGVSAGVKGARISTGPSESRITTSLPGTGISYEQRIGKKGPKQSTNRSANQKSKAVSSNEQSYTRPKTSVKKDVQTFKVTPFTIKDNKANSFARKLMKPLCIITGICAILFLIMMLFVPALILAVISILCYMNIKTPFAAVCPGCNAENLLISKEKKISCRKCKSTLIIQK